MMDLTNHFSLDEFTVSRTAIKKGIKNIPSATARSKIMDLCVEVLEPIRYNFGPVVISSGYRSPQLNKAIGGSGSSQHCKGEAVDFTCPRSDNKQVARWIESMLLFDQLILEYYPGGWIHLSLAAKNRKQVLRAVKKRGKTVYLGGLD